MQDDEPPAKRARTGDSFWRSTNETCDMVHLGVPGRVTCELQVLRKDWYAPARYVSTAIVETPNATLKINVYQNEEGSTRSFWSLQCTRDRVRITYCPGSAPTYEWALPDDVWLEWRGELCMHVYQQGKGWSNPSRPAIRFLAKLYRAVRRRKCVHLVCNAVQELHSPSASVAYGDLARIVTKYIIG